MDLALKLLHYCGQDIMGHHFIFTAIHCFVYVSCVILAFLHPVMTKGGPESWAGAFEVIVPFCQWSLRLLTMKIYKNNFRRLLLESNKFWPNNSFRPEIEARLNYIDNFVKKFYTMFSCSSILACSMMLIKPLFTIRTQRQLPAQFYHFVDLTKSPYYESAYLLYAAFCYIIVTQIVGFDGIFLGCMKGAACQLILLKEAFQQVKVETEDDRVKAREQVRLYIDHHCFILEYIKETKRLFSLLLIFQFIISTFGVCMPIYVAYSKEVLDMVFLVRGCAYSTASVFQIFMYCITSHLVKDESETVGDAFYESDWWKPDAKNLQRASVLVIQRSQLSSSLKAGGMIDVDLQSFIAVLRMSFSFFTLMQSSEAKKQIN